MIIQVGITLVGSASLLSGEGSATQTISQEQMLVGISLIIISQVRSVEGNVKECEGMWWGVEENVKESVRDCERLWSVIGFVKGSV